MPKLPEIEATHVLAKTRLFTVEEVHLHFSNNERRVYERLAKGRNLAVMIAAMPSKDEVIFVNEYAVGRHEYVLGLPKGLAESGEDSLSAANRELQEEVGLAAKTLRSLGVVYTSPGYLSSHIELVLATDLYPAKLVGDEPEPLDVVTLRLDDIGQKVADNSIRDGRTLAGLFMLQAMMSNHEG